jgi:hypothetical protein
LAALLNKSEHGQIGLHAEGVEALGFMPDVALAMESNRVVCQVLQQQITSQPTE